MARCARRLKDLGWGMKEYITKLDIEELSHDLIVRETIWHLDQAATTKLLKHVIRMGGAHGLTAEEFTFILFVKLKTVSKNIDMMSMDYLQIKMLDSLGQINLDFDQRVSILQSRLGHVSDTLPRLTNDLHAIKDGLKEVAQLEIDIKQLQKRLAQSVAPTLSSNPVRLQEPEKLPSIEELRSDAMIRRGLVALEASTAELEAAVEGRDRSPEVPDGSDEVLDAICRNVVMSLKSTLLDELPSP